ncbi:GNAT family N-acetyltransferase [Glutamicibacter mysorens]|uniref:GNAT family N-acetyltransferase n=1 Tax=Glutamicibacter mysorens TaxID=257984 RepID=UPI0020C5C611|nr:GNAT family protein [Glutamicibacter mysorens]UTM47819.1 GNAT family N-acetyltransferase [Glutamicibacter mysorens]
MKMLEQPVLDAGAYRLRPFQPRDIPTVRQASADPYIPRITTVPAQGTEADYAAFIERQHRRVAEGSGYSFAIADAVTNAAAGQIGLWLRDAHQGRASIGYWIAPGFRRRGIAKQALTALAAWGLEHPGIERVELYVEPWNEGSWRTAEACGFHREGLLRSWERVGSDRKDMYMYSRLRPAPRA